MCIRDSSSSDTPSRLDRSSHCQLLYTLQSYDRVRNGGSCQGLKTTPENTDFTMSCCQHPSLWRKSATPTQLSATGYCCSHSNTDKCERSRQHSLSNRVSLCGLPFLVSQSVRQSVSQPVRQSVSQPVRQSVSQSASKAGSQSASQSAVSQ